MAAGNTITTREQAIEQLRATRAAGHFIDWDYEKDEPDIQGADGVALEGWFTPMDIQAIGILLANR